MTHYNYDEVIILAGGLGTRLQPVTGQLPKSLAVINNRPFIDYLIQHLESLQCRHFVFALGYGSEMMQTHLQSLSQTKTNLSFSFVVEEIPLGTGGAILHALRQCRNEHVLVTNGDTLFQSDPHTALDFHLQHGACTTLMLRHLDDASRYGTVTVNEDGFVIAFQEKQNGASGWINTGMYWVNKKTLLAMSLPQTFSWEKDFLEMQAGKEKIFAAKQHGYFIDIGIPEDYNKAQHDFKTIFKDGEA
jgi:D-glycero-alpha-D-manno-heptose 1-phosphate guanylyltransferase